jgi:two-component system, NarL family, response regulator LiaR
MRIVIADSNSLVTAAIQSLLTVLGFEVVGTIRLSAKSAAETSRKRADVLLVYLSLQNGVDAMSQITRLRRQLEIPIVAVTPNISKEHTAQVLQTGVIALLPPTAAAQELATAIRSAIARKPFLSPSLPAAVHQFAKRVLNGERTPLDRLTDRQRSILKLIAEGRNTKEIAHRLKVSVKTVEFHRVRLMNRLEIYNVPSLVRLAMRSGLIRFDA